MRDAQKNSLFFYLLLLTGLFVFLEISLFIQASGLYFGVFNVVSYHLKVPASIFPGVIFFICMQIIVHLAYIFLIFYLALFVGHFFKRTQTQIEKIGITLWVLGIVTVLLANQHFYPDSKFSILTASIIPPLAAKILLIIFSGLFLFMFLLASCQLLKNKRCRLAVFLFASVGLLGSVFSSMSASKSSVATAAKPNIFIIGVDAVRPDFLGYFGSINKTPHLDDFLDHATVFADALTPLARTYPAWISILTGIYPNHNGARFDLAEHLHFDLHGTLPAILQREGYRTVYASDETRFSNIDKNLGFDQILTPPIGFNDFLLGSLNDFPFSNLLVNTFLGRYLFPYSYGNRPAYITYEPATFLDLLEPSLAKFHDKPLFFSVHFCLTHYPYIWAGRSSNTSPLDNYRQALHEADLQVYGLLKYLKRNGLLEHSIVILLSDHGEALGLPGDRITDAKLFIPGADKHMPRFYPPSAEKEQVNQSAGHGTDVLGLSQYHPVLAFRFYGVPGQVHATVPGRVSLMDIKPTLLELLSLSDQYHDGKSLLDYIRGNKRMVSLEPDFFTETDFTPQAVRSVNPETRKVLLEGIQYIQINPVTTRLTIRSSMAKLILSSKQYADFYGPWVLALYPQNKKWMTPVLVNLENRHWTTDLRTDFAKQAPTQHMLAALRCFYGKDITRIQNESS